MNQKQSWEEEFDKEFRERLGGIFDFSRELLAIKQVLSIINNKSL